MSKIDLMAVMDKYKLDKKDLAVALFPSNKYASVALTRVLNGINLLDSEQLSKLASMAGVSVDSLYTDRQWEQTSNKSGEIIFTKDDFRAVLNTDTWITKLYAKETLKHEEVLSSKTVPLSEYLEKLNEIINK